MNIPRARFISTEHFPFKTCGNADCAACTKSFAVFKVKQFLGKEHFFGSSPAPFVGRFDYPYVHVGVLSPAQQDAEAWKYDAPRFWAGQNMRIPQIVEYRAGLVNSRFRANVRSREKLLDAGREVGMASSPVDVEVQLKRKPVFRLNLEPYVAPMGPQAALRSVQVTSNPVVPASVEKAFSDTDWKAADAMLYLYRHSIDENYLTRLLSVGTLGVGSDRKLVPTRWSITATDDTLGKYAVRQVKGFDNRTEYSCYFGGYLGNYFVVLLFREQWGFELFEAYVPPHAVKSTRLTFATDSELYDGRKGYAENCGGGYYAARLPVVEKMLSLKRQGCALVMRFITDEYVMPLGVWVVREAARKAVEAKPVQFASRELLLQYAHDLVQKKFGCDAGQLFERSILLREMRTQRKLTGFFSS